MYLFQRPAYMCVVPPVSFVPRTTPPALGRFAGARTSVIASASTSTERGGGSVDRTAVSMTTAASCIVMRVLRVKISESFVMMTCVGGGSIM